MAVQPIDIQVNFSQLNTVSAEQTMAKQAALAADADSTRRMIAESLIRSERVKKIDNDMNGVSAIRDDEEEAAGKKFDENSSLKKEEAPAAAKKKIVFIDDPDKGREVDLMC